jgi:NADH/F420H2 dehydrogenase subunit C
VSAPPQLPPPPQPDADTGAPAKASSSPAAEDPLFGELRQELGDAISLPPAAPATPATPATPAIGSDLTIQVQREAVERVAAALRTRFRYTLLVDLCAADDPRRDERFEVVYHLYSFRENRRIRLRVRTGPEQPVPSVSGIWRGAAWPEREAWDLFGIRFSGHPELTRLLLWEGFHGHPLRKDFPLAGIDTGAALHHLQPLPAPAAPPAAAVADEPA